ncbi:MAG: hypothetical protein J3K34DRAFT_278389 [Monoraphidium minutum]|nr:MAG: hypothetical protein J3K34DRAFT_278389 [Monoraphidium minutum]
MPDVDPHGRAAGEGDCVGHAGGHPAGRRAQHKGADLVPRWQAAVSRRRRDEELRRHRRPRPPRRLQQPLCDADAVEVLVQPQQLHQDMPCGGVCAAQQRHRQRPAAAERHRQPAPLRHRRQRRQGRGLPRDKQHPRQPAQVCPRAHARRAVARPHEPQRVARRPRTLRGRQARQGRQVQVIRYRAASRHAAGKIQQLCAPQVHCHAVFHLRRQAAQQRGPR